MKYYFLASLLPDITLEEKPEIPFPELMHLCAANLTLADREKAAVIRRYVDIENLRLFWQGAKPDIHGSYDEKQIETNLLLEEGYPDYVFEFLHTHESTKERLEHFSGLFVSFFEKEIPKASGFLKNFLIFEHSRRLIMAAVRAEAYQKDLIEELRFEDPHDETVALLIAQKDAGYFVFPEEFEKLGKIYREFHREPLKLFREYSEWKLSAVKKLSEGDAFSIDAVLCYLARLIIAEDWMLLNAEEGSQVMNGVMEKLP